MSRLRALVRDWLAPGLAGLAGAAVLIAGAEQGGVLGGLVVAAAAVGLLGFVVWATRSAYDEDGYDDWYVEDDPADE